MDELTTRQYSHNPYLIPYTHCPICKTFLASTMKTTLGTFNCTSYPHYSEELPKMMTWIQCQKCTHIYTSGYWSTAGLDILLAKAHAGQIVQNNFEEKRFLWSAVVEKIFSQINDPHKVFTNQCLWLDVGCGDGALLMTAVEFGFNTIGLDVRTEVIQRLKTLGYQTIQSDFLQVAVAKPCHVISMADILEHLADPVGAIKKAHQLLGPKGLLYISCPNTQSASWQEMDRNQSNPYWSEMEHHHNFS